MPQGAAPEGFSRRHRFSARGSFGGILRSPRKLRGRFCVLHVAQGSPGASRLGIALTRKLVRSAVERNAVKRAVRETFRRHPARDLGLDCVLTLRERTDRSRIAPIAAEVGGFLDQLCGTDRR